MGFGRNPHVAKAEAAELKAQTARDASFAEQAWREAGRQWERAAAREADGKRRALYEANAEKARATADAPFDANVEASDGIAVTDALRETDSASDGDPNAN
ncbi:MAG TPA: hypothetical protein VGM39_12270 [Kofleriaceae bacterium]|jgi:hypothetical protein